MGDKKREITLCLYRNLVRQCILYDKSTKYKQYFVTPKCLRPMLPTFFLPSVSFYHNLKVMFRQHSFENINNTSTDLTHINESLGNGFNVLKNLNLGKNAYHETNSDQLNSHMKNFYNKIGHLKNEHEIDTSIDSTLSKPITITVPINNKPIINDQQQEQPILNIQTTPTTTTTTTTATTITPPTPTTTSTTTSNLKSIKSNTSSLKKLTKKEQIKQQKQQLLQKQQNTINENKNKQFWPINDEGNDEDSESGEIKAGTLLIAHPSLGDAFSKKVVLITHVIDGRHYGLFINNPILTGPALTYINMELKPVFDKVTSDNNHSKNFSKLFKYALKRPLSPLQRTNWNYGGPESITMNSVLVPGIEGLSCSQILHPYQSLVGSKKIRDGLFIGGKLKDIGDKIRAKEVDPNRLHMFVGCTVWRPNQLEKEIKEGAWFKANCTNDLIFKQKKTPDFWAESLNSMGGDYSDLVKSNFTKPKL